MKCVAARERALPRAGSSCAGAGARRSSLGGRSISRSSDRWQYAKVYFTRAAVAKMRRENGGGAVVHAHVEDGTVSTYAPYESEFQIDL